MKNAFTYIFGILLTLGAVSYAIYLQERHVEKLENQQKIADSIKREELIRDSISRVQNMELLANPPSNIYIEGDDFSNVKRVRSSNIPSSLNAIWCSFKIVDNIACDFSFNFKYIGSLKYDIKYIIFNIDGELLTVVPTNMHSRRGEQICSEIVFETNAADAIEIPKTSTEKNPELKALDDELRSDIIHEKAKVATRERLMDIEYSTEGSTYTPINKVFIEKLANAKSVKIKMISNSYYDTRTITNDELSHIKTIFEYYQAAGGYFK